MFSAQTRGYFESARGFGRLASPTHQGAVGSEEEGHYFRLQLQLDAQGIVQDLAYYCPRCLPAVACGGYLYQRLVGRPSLPCVSLEELLTELGGLPPQRSFYAWMAVQALEQALKGGYRESCTSGRGPASDIRSSAHPDAIPYGRLQSALRLLLCQEGASHHDPPSGLEDA